MDVDGTAGFFRRFVVANHATIHDGWTIVDKAIAGDEDAETLLLHCSNTRLNSDTRRDMADIRLARTQGNSHWLGPLCSSAFILFSTYRKLAMPLYKPPVIKCLESLTKEQRQVFAPTGLITARKEVLYKAAQDKVEELKLSLAGHPVVVWCDNYNKRKWAKNPSSDRNLGVNATAFAIMELPELEQEFAGYPTLKSLFLEITSAIKALQQMRGQLPNLRTRLRLQHLGYDDVRCPIDIRREEVFPPVWHPFDLLADNIAETKGLVAVLKHAFQIQEDVNASSMALLCDQNIYYRTMKLLYGRTYMGVNMHGFLRKVPLLHGVWHSYKMVVRALYNVFLPFMAWIDEGPAYSVDPEEAKVYQNPPMFRMESVVLGIFLCAQGQRDLVKRKIQPWLTKTDPVIVDRSTKLEALYVLLHEYIPLLFILGRLVRNLNWERHDLQSSQDAYDVNRICLLMLLALRGKCNPTDFQSYVDTLCLVLLNWKEYHKGLPGISHAEEHLEAMLSRLNSRLNEDLTANNLTAYCTHFIRLGSSTDGSVSKDRDKAGIPRQWKHMVDIRIEKLIEAICRDDLPFIKYNSKKKKTISGTYRWPRLHKFPESISTVDDDTIEAAFVTAVWNVSKRRMVTAKTSMALINQEVELVRNMCSEVAPVSDQRLQARQEALDTLDSIAEKYHPKKDKKRQRDDVDGEQEVFLRPLRRRQQRQGPRHTNVLTDDSDAPRIPVAMLDEDEVFGRSCDEDFNAPAR